jgi:hypothetical protein
MSKNKYSDKGLVIIAGRTFLASGHSRSPIMGAYKCKNCKGWHLTSQILEVFDPNKFLKITLEDILVKATSEATPEREAVTC